MRHPHARRFVWAPAQSGPIGQGSALKLPPHRARCRHLDARAAGPLRRLAAPPATRRGHRTGRRWPRIARREDSRRGSSTQALKASGHPSARALNITSTPTSVALPGSSSLGGQGSNLQQPAPKAGVLPVELPPTGSSRYPVTVPTPPLGLPLGDPVGARCPVQSSRALSMRFSATWRC
jgi:hypothetical protein